ncbi:hypothetical protein [uncultured Kordia sp.]|uniref:hypothetical protein n=1 Tax=uncultured Kordia sp. TaxID=507699 RepID=UPI002612317A|nr:hypothetical protein [uncultured Kordia sp.]
MNKIILVVAFLFSWSMFGQNFPPKKYEYYDFSKIEATISDTEKLDLLKKCADSKYLNLYTPAISVSGEFSNYHVLDLNADGLLDIIYNNKEADGIEKTVAAIYINEKDSLRPVIKLLGNFTKINVENHQLKSFQMIEFPCCNEASYWLRNYEFNNATDCYVPMNGSHERYKYSYGEVNDPRFCVSLESKYKFFMQTQFPENSKEKDIVTVTEKVYATIKPSKPTNINLKNNDYTDFYEGNKAISIVKEGTRCYVFEEQKDETGEVFCFVKFKTSSEISTKPKYKNYYVYGWLPKRNLK